MIHNYKEINTALQINNKHGLFGTLFQYRTYNFDVYRNHIKFSIRIVIDTIAESVKENCYGDFYEVKNELKIKFENEYGFVECRICFPIHNKCIISNKEIVKKIKSNARTIHSGNKIITMENCYDIIDNEFITWLNNHFNKKDYKRWLKTILGL